MRLKDEYLKELTKLIDEFKEKSIILREDGAGDEAILETIKANVCDIFYKLFNVSYKKSFDNSEDSDECYSKLYIAYNDFLNKIPAPWVGKMAKDKENHMMEEFYKEQIKLETAKHIKDLFEEYYNKYREEV